MKAKDKYPTYARWPAIKKNQEHFNIIQEHVYLKSKTLKNNIFKPSKIITCPNMQDTKKRF